MNNDIALSLEDVGKAYRIWKNPGSRLAVPAYDALARALPGSWQGTRRLRAHANGLVRDFWALKGVNLEVRRGEAFGVVGRNGSGKSTLLQIIAGTLRATTGRARVNGRIAALLELGSGFNPEFTGRENVVLNGAILGLSSKEMHRRLDEIVDFADIGEFIDEPIKTYSSGMLVRLAFSVQTAVEPDILIVDEALAVGDAPFRAKCYAKIRGLCDRGVSLFFVSHDLNTVKTLCRNALLLHRGSPVHLGPAHEVIQSYELMCAQERGVLPQAAAATPKPILPPPSFKALNPDFAKHAAEKRAGTRDLEFIDFAVLTADGVPAKAVDPEVPYPIRFLLRANRPIDGEIHVSVQIKDLKGREYLTMRDTHFTQRVVLPAGGVARGTMMARFPLRYDDYYLSLGLHSFPAGRKYVDGVYNYDAATMCDLIEFGYFLHVDAERRHWIVGPVHQEQPLKLEIAPAP